MDLYGRSIVVSTKKTYPTHNPEWAQVGLKESEKSLENWEGEMYPERIGQPNCQYYMRTGSCGYAANCRFNHPRNRGLLEGFVSFGGDEYPERVGQQDCQYYLRTRTCKFGKSCRFNHPRNLDGSLINVPLNAYGYPLRPGEKECSYYLKTGLCKFGISCKLHHPQPAGVSVPPSACPIYPVQASPVVPTGAFGGVFTNYMLQRPPLFVNSYLHGANGAVQLHAGVLLVANWSSYQGLVDPTLSRVKKPSVEAMGVNEASQAFTSYPPSPSGHFGSNLKPKEFPERQGQPQCPYYMKHGDCKYGACCRYHHPPARLATRMYCFLSPLGLPLRPGVQSCKYYMQNGSCKYGENCKFDHPLGGMQYSPPSSLLGDTPVATYPFSPSATTGVFSNEKSNLSSSRNTLVQG